MNLVEIKCAFCGKRFFRNKNQRNEAAKFGWNQYCSKKCQNKAKITRIENVCGDPNCNNKVSRSLNQFKKSKSGLVFCSHSCAATFNNAKRPKRKLKLKTCLKCGKQFRKSTGNKKYCSIKCRKETYLHTPKEIIGIIKDTTERLGRIPVKRDLREIDYICRKFFGSWNNAVAAAGLEPNRSHSDRMYKRIIIKASDGHSCDSASEAIIDNWLTKNNIAHERDIHYPNTHHKADWGITFKNKKIFVEYFGLANDSPRYDRAIKKKKQLCRKNNILLIEIYPQDIFPRNFLNQNLKNKFKNFL
jgi:hypothetical protein